MPRSGCRLGAGLFVLEMLTEKIIGDTGTVASLVAERRQRLSAFFADLRFFRAHRADILHDA